MTNQRRKQNKSDSKSYDYMIIDRLGINELEPAVAKIKSSIGNLSAFLQHKAEKSVLPIISNPENMKTLNKNSRTKLQNIINDHQERMDETYQTVRNVLKFDNHNNSLKKEYTLKPKSESKSNFIMQERLLTKEAKKQENELKKNNRKKLRQDFYDFVNVSAEKKEQSIAFLEENEDFFYEELKITKPERKIEENLPRKEYSFFRCSKILNKTEPFNENRNYLTLEEKIDLKLMKNTFGKILPFNWAKTGEEFDVKKTRCTINNKEEF